MGLFRAGPLGGLVAIVFWILPSGLIMTLAGLGARSYLQGTIVTRSMQGSPPD